MSVQSYFSHDSNARNSEKLIRVRMDLGAAGYGIFFMILERLREETNYMSVKDYNIIAFDLRVDSSLVKKVIENYGLFVFTEDGKYFYSESFLNRMEFKDQKSIKRSEAGKKGAAARWGKEPDNLIDSSNDMANDNKNNGSAIAEPKKNMPSKEKESKEKISKDNVAADAADNPNKNSFNADSVEIELSKYLYSKILLNKPNTKEPNYGIWAKDIALLIQDSGESPSTIKNVIDFATSNSFWKSIILKASNLADKFATLEIQMREQGNSNNSSKKRPSYYKPEANKNNYKESEAIKKIVERINREKVEKKGVTNEK